MKYRIGVDIGASGVKLAIFDGVGAKARLVGFDVFAASDEGILTEEELYRGIKEFLNDKSYGRSCLCMGIPQYQVTTSVADYPRGKGHNLAQMVAMDAMQIGGLSDASFVHGFASLPPGNGRQSPVLIAMSREDGVCERLEKLGEAGIDCDSLVPSGLALANAAYGLCAGLADSAEPALLLDIGRENTIIAVVVGGQVLYVSTLMFTGTQLEDAAKAAIGQRRHAVGGMSAQQLLEQVDLMSESGQSPFRQAVLTLESEIQNAVEHWRSQENDVVANMPITHVYLTGGGSRLGGLSAWLKGILECDVETFGPEVEGQVRPELSVAYGLGLHSAGRCRLAISLIPAAVRLSRLRQRRWPLLAVAAGVFFVTVFSVLISHRITNAMTVDELSARKSKLNQCLEIANRIKATRQDAVALERKTAALAVIANRSNRVVQAVRLLSQAPLQHSWLIYLSNELADDGKEDFFAYAQAAAKTLGGISQEPSSPREQLVFRNGRSENEFVCAGYAPENHRNEVAELMSFLEKGNADGRFFAGVDRGDTIADRASQLVWLWREYLNENEKRLALGLKMQTGRQGSFVDKFELFTLRLPFAKGDIRRDDSSDGEED